MAAVGRPVGVRGADRGAAPGGNGAIHQKDGGLGRPVWADTGDRTPVELSDLHGGGEYIGWCGAYRIGEDCECDPEGRRVAIGIDLPERQARGKGLATRALRLFMAYQYEQGERELYTQTWSGNERMIGLARKLGFEEYCRKAGVRTVRGKQYDGLTFRKML